MNAENPTVLWTVFVSIFYAGAIALSVELAKQAWWCGGAIRRQLEWLLVAALGVLAPTVVYAIIFESFWVALIPVVSVCGLTIAYRFTKRALKRWEADHEFELDYGGSETTFPVPRKRHPDWRYRPRW